MKNKRKAYGIVLYIQDKNDTKLLLCKSVNSKDRWGCVKGLILKDETSSICAKREFFEESSIEVDIAMFENYFEQKNIDKDIGIWLVNALNIDELDKYFDTYRLKKKYLSSENTSVEFFSVNNLPLLKKKQEILIHKIKDFL